MSIGRRVFIKSGAIAAVGFGCATGSLPGFLVRAAEAASARRKTVVVLFQRGAADGLNIVVPHGDPTYYKLRPSIAIPRPRRDEPDTVLDIDGFFGFHPALKPLKELYDREMLAVIHAAGSPDATRSHFDAQDFMESGTPGVKRTQDGWLNRYLQAHPAERATSFRAVATTSQLPRVLGGQAAALAIPDLSKFGIEGRYRKLARRGLEALYASSDDALLSSTARETFEAVDYLERVDPARHRPANGAVYPGGAFGGSLLQVAQLIKSDVGLEVAFVEIGGWDHHVNEGGGRGALANLLQRFSSGLGAFVRDLGDRMQDVVVVTLSEFGRTAKENGSRGTDHGHATTMFVVGGPVGGGRLYGKWPGLESELLYEGRDLALTTDFRDVLGRVLSGHLGGGNLDPVFPGHRFSTGGLDGLI
jgi:uncharacterized protein (DUF1501 family)